MMAYKRRSTSPDVFSVKRFRSDASTSFVSLSPYQAAGLDWSPLQDTPLLSRNLRSTTPFGFSTPALFVTKSSQTPTFSKGSKFLHRSSIVNRLQYLKENMKPEAFSDETATRDALASLQISLQSVAGPAVEESEPEVRFASIQVQKPTPLSVTIQPSTPGAMIDFIDGLSKDINTLLHHGHLPSPIVLSKYRELASKDAQATQVVEDKKKSKSEEGDSVNFPKLTEDQLKQVEKILSHPPGIKVVEHFNMVIQTEDTSKLKDRQWLNDEIINFYCKLIMERSEKNPSKPRVYTFNTFFYLTMTKDGYDGVKRWTKKVDIFKMDHVIFPVHLGMHWCLANINLKDKRFEYYDSLQGDNPQVIKVMREYIQLEHQSKKGQPLNTSDWTVHVPKDGPCQENGYDCGVFACQFAEFVSRNQPLVFSQKHMQYYRKRMVWEIANKTLLIK